MYLVYSFNVDGKIYVGITQNPKYRWRPSAYQKEREFYKLIVEHGWKNVKKSLEIWLMTDDYLEAVKMEGKLIDKYQELGISLNTYKSGYIYQADPNNYRKMWNRKWRAKKKENKD